MVIQFLLNIFISAWVIDLYIINQSKKLKYFKSNNLSIDNFMFLENILTKFGCVFKKDIITYTILIIIIPILSIIISITNTFSNGVILFLVGYLMIYIIIISKKKALNLAFSSNSYKLYKYMFNQIDAGVLPKDALISLHEVVEDKQLKEILYKACGAYQFTLNPRSASGYIKKYIKTQEAQSFAMFIEDIAFEGCDRGITKRLEQLMFNRYFTYIQRKTEQVKTKSMITVITFCSIIVIMILIPMYMDVQDALTSIFS